MQSHAYRVLNGLVTTLIAGPRQTPFPVGKPGAEPTNHYQQCCKAGTADTDAVNKQQLDTALTNFYR